MSFVWILVLSPWVGLLVLILDDVTKDDSNGGAVRVATKSFGSLIERTALGPRKLWKALNHTISRTSASRPPPDVAAPGGNSSLSSAPAPRPPLIGQPRIALLKKSERNGGRTLSTIPDLELAITEAVKKVSPECETFVGVVLERTKPRSRRDVNWRLRGVKFGQADRKIASDALTSIIERMQRDFYLAER
ncbi:MAG: hypothetical protein WA303_18350 [Bradyrhizobium sp.]